MSGVIRENGITKRLYNGRIGARAFKARAILIGVRLWRARANAPLCLFVSLAVTVAWAPLALSAPVT